jgi:hypothetical protein
MVQRLLPHAGGLHEHIEVGLDPLLADVIRQTPRSQAALEGVFDVVRQPADDSFIGQDVDLSSPIDA